MPKIDTTHNLADMLKSLDKDKFAYCLKLVGMCSVSGDAAQIFKVDIVASK